jgi:cyclophilin family peptidyl-prolyl cis-trans isomerase
MGPMSTFARFDTTEGSFTIRLFDQEAPNTVANFVGLAEGTRDWTDPRTGQKKNNTPFYDGIIFHRVIDGFMIQGGGFTADFSPKPTRPPIVNEAEMSSKAGLKNAPGTIAMARTSDPNSATNQFFINVNDNSRLNFRSPDPTGIGYTVFGKVVAGMDVVNKIAKAPKGGGKPVPPGTPVDPRDVPSQPIVITSAKIIDSAK